jgi:hypothetical protein
MPVPATGLLEVYLCVWLVLCVGFIFQPRSRVSQFDSRLFAVVAGTGASFVPDVHHQPPNVQLTSARFCMSPRLFRAARKLSPANPFLPFRKSEQIF